MQLWNKGKNLKDVIVFGKTISIGLLIAGYAFVGVYVSRWLTAKGYSYLLAAAAPVVFILLGIWQAWLVLSQLIGKKGKRK